ncbi:hypothetical protein CR513_30599, partial [Mucuna pruriens]
MKHVIHKEARRSSANNLHDLDLEIDRTLHSSDSFNSVSNSVNNSFATNSEFLDCSNSSFYVKLEPTCVENKAQELEQMENQGQTLKELATPDVVYQPWCIQYAHKGLAIPTAGSFLHLGRYEAHVSREVLLSVQNYHHLEGYMWDQETLRRNHA